MLRTIAIRIAGLQTAQSSGKFKNATNLCAAVSAKYAAHPPKLLPFCRKNNVSFSSGAYDTVHRTLSSASSEQTEVGSRATSTDKSKLEDARKEVADLLTIGWQAPESISDMDLEHYMTLTTKSGRKKFLRFLAKKEIIKRKEKMMKEERARQKAEQRALKVDEELDEFPNRYLLRVHGNAMLQFDQSRLAAGMMFGPKIAFDFSYEDLMRRQEVSSLVQQLLHSMNANKHAKDPFAIHWVGLTEETQSLKRLRHILGDSLENIMVNETEKDLLEVFPKDQLIYMSADSPNVLQSFDSDKVHVIGALVDRNIIYTGQSLARAKRHGIEHARLPLDRHLQWATGAKNLTLDQMIKILLELNASGDWIKALQHVPIRKHAGLRSGPHWDAEAESPPSRRRTRQDNIQRNPSHFVSSRAKKSKAPDRSKVGSKKKTFVEEEDDIDSTLFSSRAKGHWFDSE
ncbi:tRNA methyltransferase 10 homolog C-like [Diadema antillarum]|uniref:tRNA methyltransferase 10 homolog C-like n=1 Tax=Diadema antillarum TaxID=105358 RepID=UPI003A87D36E